MVMTILGFPSDSPLVMRGGACCLAGPQSKQDFPFVPPAFSQE